MFGHFLRQERDLAGAEAIYNSLAANKASEAQILRARNEIAGVRLLEGKKDEARAIIEEILAKDSGNPDALSKRAGLEIDAKNYDGAIADLRTVLASKPDMVSAKLLMASAFEGKGDIEFATSQLAQAVADSKKSGETSRLFAGFLMRHDDNSRAEQVLLDSLAAFPRDVETLKHLAALRLMRQDWRGAEEAAKLIEAVNKEEPSAKRILGVALTGLEDYSGAIDALTAANEEAPLAAQPLATLVSAFLKEDRAGDAEKLLTDMIKSNEGNYEARVLMARVLGSQNRLSDMEQALQEAIIRAPERPEAVEALYRLLIASKRFEDAETMLKARIDTSPENDAFKVLFADLLIATGRREEALGVYADILTRRPGDLLVSNNYASILLELRDDPESAAQALDVARAFEGSENPYFIDTLGWAQFRNGDVDSAIATLERTVRLADNFAEAHYHLGAAYLAAGREAEGRASLEKAVSQAPQASFAEKARALLAGK
jgi:predicted Zn-dependent protease